MLTPDQLAEITGLADATLAPRRHDERDVQRIGVVGRGLLCRLSEDNRVIATLPVRLRDVSAEGVSLLCPQMLRGSESFLFGIERAGWCGGRSS